MGYNQADKSISLKEKRNSWLAAAFLVETLLCKVITVFVPIPYISVIGMIGIMFVLLLLNQKFNTRIMGRQLMVFSIWIILLFSSCLLNGLKYVGTYLIYFLVFGMTAMLLTMVDLDFKTVLVAVLKLSLLYIVVYFVFERNSFMASENYWSNQMGLAYGLLTPAIAGMVGLWKRQIFEFDRMEKMLSWICMIAGIYIICIDCGTRGAMVSVALAIGLLFIEKETSYKKILLLLIMGLAVILVVVNLKAVLLFTYGLLLDRGIDVPALTKMVWMMERSIADNGRSEVYTVALELIKENPVTGHGVGYFESKYYGAYAHNFILQLLCEFGMIGTICVGIPIIGNFIKTFGGKKIHERENALSILLFLVTIPMLMFSSSYWLLPSFWLYFWFVVKNVTLRIKV